MNGDLRVVLAVVAWLSHVVFVKSAHAYCILSTGCILQIGKLNTEFHLIMAASTYVIFQSVRQYSYRSAMCMCNYRPTV